MSSATLSDILVEFIENTILGQMSGCYKVGFGLKYTSIYQVTLVDYFNILYKSLILEDDKYVVEKFTKMQSFDNHSCICLLNILFYASIMTCSKIQESNLELNNGYEVYIDSCTKEIRKTTKEIKESLDKSISHKCTGIDIKTCDPNVEMFKIMHN